MADSFFGFDTSVPGGGLDDAIECPLDEDDIIEEDEYDALNDETFGLATDDDWEKNHEQLAQIAESTRLQKQLINNKNGIDVDIEGSLSHLVLDEKDGIVPRPGVWDSPSNLPIVPPNPPLSVALKNVCTVEELERGLMRPPPGLVKPSTPQPTNINTNNINTTTINQPQPQQLPVPRPGGQFPLDYPTINDHISANLRANILNNMPPRFPPGLSMPGQHPVILPPNVRLSNAQLLQNTRPLAGNPAAAAAAAAAANLLRYPLPPHLMIAHNNQRQPMHGNFPVGNFPQPPRPNLPPPQFMRPEHPLMSPFPNNLPNHHQHHQQQHLHQLQHQHQQHQQQNQHQQNQHQQQHHHQQQQQHQLSINQRNHNRSSYQTNDQSSSNNQPFFKNNQHWNQNRNNQRYHHHNNHHVNGYNENGEYDEYAGMMSNREKQWLTNIQLMQHNTNQPYFDDYYYTVFCDRQNKKNNENSDNHKDKKQNNKNGYRDRDNKDQSQHILTKVVYTPTQFENSLGKLQCGSVTAPRKIIDMDVVPNSDPQQNQQAQQKDMKKARQRLLEIERLYTVQLKLEDVNNPLALLAEQQALQQQQQQQQETDQETESKPVKKTAAELINIMLTSILQLLREDKLSSILSIRKGKTLLLRFLPFLSVTEYTQQLGEFWVGFIRGLAVISRRDANYLVRFFPEFHRWIETIDDFYILLRLAKGFLESVNQPNKNNNSLALAVTNKFGVSVLASLLERAETLYPNDEDGLSSEWSTFILTLADIIGSSPPSVAPCQPIPANTLNEHLQRIRGLTIERYAPLESLLTDANPSL
ncbi:protein PAT1 homolog 1 [Microplitis demolitor]|uniref:protein PAT1 homolog 1 n=1 Tax=Microplitis demolitor TaxID=69319 RepID=UPI0004CD189A|nr:protein PAT1 homolog 1 [Microplitis demolitor]